MFTGAAHLQVRRVIQGMYNRVWEFGGPSQNPAYHISGEQNCGKSRRSWRPISGHWRCLSHHFSKFNVYVNLLGIVLKLDSDLVWLRWRPDSPNNLVGDNSAACRISKPKLMMTRGWARLLTVEMRNGLTGDMI